MYRRAILYFGPSFSSSAITQSVMDGMPVNKKLRSRKAKKDRCLHFAYRQSIIPDTSSSLFCKLKLIKFVSTSTRYGGPSEALCDKKSEEETCVLLSCQIPVE